MIDLTEDIIETKRIVLILEIMILNPMLSTRDETYNELIKLDNRVLGMLTKLERQ